MKNVNTFNDEKANAIQSLILNKLLQNDPRPTELTYLELTGYGNHTDCPRDKYDLASSVIDYLDREGYIRAGRHGAGLGLATHFRYDTSLTEKGREFIKRYHGSDDPSCGNQEQNQKEKIRVGILNKGKNNSFIGNTVTGFDVGLQDEGENTTAKDNTFNVHTMIINPKKWYQFWWMKYLIYPSIVTLTVAYIVHILHWN